ncbi:MAG: tetratricopeptide repeat protein [Oscillospiraceae bacterium]|nr:tetratricopeptide repeat protein [Oscillospiraceae bacterium]
MKSLRYILPGLVILAVVGLLGYEAFVAKDLQPSSIARGGLIIAGAVLVMVKKPQKRTPVSKKTAYQTGYSQFIQEPFADDPKLEKRFYNAIHNYSTGSPSKALQALNKLRSECRNTQEIYSVTVFTALSLYDMGRWQDALSLYDDARKIKDCSTLASNMGICCSRMGDFDRAIEFYQEAIRLDSKNAVVYNNLSALYFARGEYENSLAYAKDALECQENMPQALSTAAICCKLLGDEEGYDSYYRRAVAAGYDGATIKKAIKRLKSKI